MAEALIIRFPTTSIADESSPAQWMLVDANHHRMGAVVTGTLQEASGLAANRRVLAVVNGSAVLHTEPVLPPLKGGAKLAQVVPFALEDQLAADVDELHFAIGKRATRPGTPIAVVAHQQIQQWLSELQSAGLFPAAIYTDTFTVPASNEAINILIDQGRVLMRGANIAPVCLDISPLDEALKLAIPEFTETTVSIYVPEAEYDSHRASIEALHVRTPNLQIKLLPEGALPLLATQAIQGDSINLLQGIYEPKRDLNMEFKPWRTAAIFIAVLFCLHLVVTGTHWWQLKRQESRLDQQITETFSQGLPGSSPINPSQARRTFESRLVALQSAGTDSQLLQSLGAMADAINKTPGSQIEDLAYRENILNVRMLVASVDALDSIRKLAASHGLTVDIQSANPRDNKIEGRLQIKSVNAH